MKRIKAKALMRKILRKGFIHLNRGC